LKKIRLRLHCYTLVSEFDLEVNLKYVFLQKLTVKNAKRGEEQAIVYLQESVNLYFMQAMQIPHGILFTRQNDENVNPFGAIASVAGDRSRPWTGWIGLAPV